jgi:2',3'-cyclic-nucleotide 2'-phosphodiesterase (5'-nucleotidase family)
MKRTTSLRDICVAGCVMLACATSTTAFANGHKKNWITLIQLGDTHGHMHAHTEVFGIEPNVRIDSQSGGLAKLTTLINEVRVDNPDALLLAIGDTTHGSAEMLFSAGDLIMPWLNYIGIDAFTPGNWDFGWGPRVYRQRFTADNPPLAPNNRTTIAWMDGMPGREDQTCNLATYFWQPPGANTAYNSPFVPANVCSVTKANFPTVAMNVYNFNELAGAGNAAQPLGPPVHLHDGKTYLIKDVDGKKVAILGLTSDVVPQQAQAFNTSFRFTMGYKEMSENIAGAKADGADLIVVLSELGLAKNVQMVKEFPEIDVMFSGHTHERTPEAIVIQHSDENGGHISLVTESGEDSFLGRLDLKINGAGEIINYKWDLMEADHTVAEDEYVDEMVDELLSSFHDTLPNGDHNPEFQCHTFGVNAFAFGTGHTNCDSLDKVIGQTSVTIQRWNVLEDISNNVMVDAFLDLAQSLGVTDSKGKSLTDDNTLSTTNGFRFDIVIPGSLDIDEATGEHFSGLITVGDLYDYYPIGAATALAEYTGGRLKTHWEGILDNVFDPNPFRQRGGWFLGFTHNMHFDLRLSDDFPRSISYGPKRIAKVTVNDVKVDDSKIYTLASCYPHGNPTDEVCRTTGATNLRFITALQEHAGEACGPEFPCDIFGNRQLNMSGTFAVVDPQIVTDGINTCNDPDCLLPVFDPVRFGNAVPVPFGGTQTGPLFRKVAPDNFVHPVDALKRYLPGYPITAADFGRVNAIDPVPASEYGGDGIVQPTQGAGATWLKREFVIQDNQNQQ